jgi:hypothetical protein
LFRPLLSHFSQDGHDQITAHGQETQFPKQGETGDQLTVFEGSADNGKSKEVVFLWGLVIENCRYQ